jgi:hypothetical protein
LNINRNFYSIFYILSTLSTFGKSGAKNYITLYPLLGKVEQKITLHFIHFWEKWSKKLHYTLFTFGKSGAKNYITLYSHFAPLFPKVDKVDKVDYFN